ncbi:hypothetical protein [Akkermansia muciniphila]|uniref:hypothetical protein n=1 Tax=Akkermansia muciniphila TaxID=239935 RepID=UPI001F092A52|nr:hypothetical protein [Akkermansia muciniphila]
MERTGPQGREHGGIRPSKRRNTHGPAQSRGLLPECGKPDGLFTYMQEGREDAAARPSLVGVGVLSLQMWRQRFGQRRPQGTGLDA